MKFMKKLFLIIAIAVSVVGAKAQEGTWYLGLGGVSPFGGIESNLGTGVSLSPMTGFSSLTLKDDYKVTNFGIAPEVGYFINDQIAVGLGLFFTGSTYSPDVDGATDTKYTTFGFNPYVRYHFLAKGDFKAYGQFNVAYASAKPDTDGAKALNAFEVNVVPGVAYSLTDNVAINATFGSLGYATMGKLKDNGVEASAFGLNLDSSSLKFGITVAF